MLFQKRNVYYKKLYAEGALYDKEIEKGPESFEAIIKVPIEILLFKFGVVACRYLVPQVNVESEFEVENKQMRPEFEVLKPYFAKYLKVKSVRVNLNYNVEFNKIKIVYRLFGRPRQNQSRISRSCQVQICDQEFDR